MRRLLDERPVAVSLRKVTPMPLGDAQNNQKEYQHSSSASRSALLAVRRSEESLV